MKNFSVHDVWKWSKTVKLAEKPRPFPGSYPTRWAYIVQTLNNDYRYIGKPLPPRIWQAKMQKWQRELVTFAWFVEFDRGGMVQQMWPVNWKNRPQPGIPVHADRASEYVYMAYHPFCDPYGRIFGEYMAGNIHRVKLHGHWITSATAKLNNADEKRALTRMSYALPDIAKVLKNAETPKTRV